MAALLVVGLVAGVAASVGGGGSSTDASASSSTTAATVARDGAPRFCEAIAAFQRAYLVVAEPSADATPAEVEAAWDGLAVASAALVETAPAEMAGFVQPVVGAFDTLRQDADAVGFEYATVDDLESAATIDPDGSIAQSAYALFTYGEQRCPLPDATGTTAG